MLHALIMAGGGGTRFWPRSRVKRPKQFLTFSGERTLLQEAVDRRPFPAGQSGSRQRANRATTSSLFRRRFIRLTCFPK